MTSHYYAPFHPHFVRLGLIPVFGYPHPHCRGSRSPPTDHTAIDGNVLGRNMEAACRLRVQIHQTPSGNLLHSY